VTDAGSAFIGAAAAITGGAVTGAFALWGIGRTNRANAAQLATQFDHERSMAREARQQDRRAQAYVELLKYLHWLGRFLSGRNISFIQTGEGTATTIDEGPTQEERDNVLALVTAFGSDEVQESFDDLMKRKIVAINGAHMQHQVAAQQNELNPMQAQNLTGLHHAITDAYKETFQAIEDLRRHITAELRT
jgi:hypothetical protein